MSEGRANLTTQLKRVGEESWAPIGELPEFGATGTSHAGTGFAPSNESLLSPSVLDEAAPLDVFDCFDRSWQLFKTNLGPSIGATMITVVITFIVDRMSDKIPANAGVIVSSLLTSVLFAGYNYYFLLRARGQPAGVGDVFIGFRTALVPLLLVTLVSCLIVFLGFAFFILPGIYLGVGYAFASLLAVDKKLNFWDALETSRRVVTKQWWRVLGLLCLSMFVSALGLIAFGIGVVFTIPIATGALVNAYDHLFRTDESG